MSSESRVTSHEEYLMQKRIVRFEDLIAWQKAKTLAREIYQVTRQGDFAKDFGLSG